MTGHEFTILAVADAIESLPPAATEQEIQLRHQWVIRAIECKYVAECGEDELAERMREFFAARFGDQIGPLLDRIEEERQAEADDLHARALQLNKIADEPELAGAFARVLGRDKGVNARAKGITKRTARTR